LLLNLFLRRWRDENPCAVNRPGRRGSLGGRGRVRGHGRAAHGAQRPLADNPGRYLRLRPGRHERLRLQRRRPDAVGGAAHQPRWLRRRQHIRPLLSTFCRRERLLQALPRRPHLPTLPRLRGYRRRLGWLHGHSRRLLRGAQPEDDSCLGLRRDGGG
jgi:hypothetical protein